MSVSPPRRIAGVLTLAVAAATVLATVPAGPALAYTDTFQAGTLTITGTNGDDTLSVTCDGGKVRVNTDNLTTNCNAVTTLKVRGGKGNDDLSIPGVIAATYTALTTVTVSGQDGNDTLDGRSGPETLLGGNGFDFLKTSAGDDAMNGGKNYDRIAGIANVNWTATNISLTGAGSDTLASIQEVDLEGGASANIIDASAFDGFAELRGLGSNDTLSAGSGGSFLSGGTGGDILNGGSARDSMEGDDQGGTGSDTLNGAGGNDHVAATVAGDAVITDTAMTGAGTDSLSSIEQGNVWSTGAGTTVDGIHFNGDLSLTVAGGGGQVLGGSGDDFLQGGGTVFFDGNGGFDDVLMNGDGDWTATPNTLVLDGVTATHTDLELIRIFGTSMDQTFDASQVTQKVEITPGDGNDTVIGNGNKTLVIASIVGATKLTNSKLTTPTDTVDLSQVGGAYLYAEGKTSLSAGSFSKPITFWGSPKADNATTGRGKDLLIGQDGNDKLNAGRGADRVTGQDGRDRLSGGKGTDGCNGGAGVDTLISCEKKTPDPIEQDPI